MARDGSERRARVASLVRQVVAELLTFQVKDPRVAGVTVTDAEVTGDLREAKVFYYLDGDEAKRAAAQLGLDRAAGFMRRELGQRVNMRTTPSIRFVFDQSLDYGTRIEEKLRELGLGDTKPGPTTDGEAEPDPEAGPGQDHDSGEDPSADGR